MYYGSFKGIRRTAERHGFKTYEQWRKSLERQYAVMPRWYRDEASCRTQYASYVKMMVAWQKHQTEHGRSTDAAVMTPEEALRRIVEDADLIHWVVEHEELRPKNYLLVKADDELLDYLATYKAEDEDMEPSHGADQPEGDGSIWMGRYAHGARIVVDSDFEQDNYVP